MRAVFRIRPWPVAPLPQSQYASMRRFATRAGANPSTKEPRLGARIIKGTLLGVYGIGFLLLGIYAKTSPIGGMLLHFGMLSDRDSLLQFDPRDQESRLVDEHINCHPLVVELRKQENLVESRPHMKIPAPFRPHNLTAGTLLGPGRVTVPPVAWVQEGGKSIVSVAHLGSDLCGHPGIVHGGVLATILDEGLARCCWDALPRQIAVTAKLEINYRKPVRAGTYVVLRARTVKVEGRKAWVEGRIETLVNPGDKPEILAEAAGLFISPKSSTVLSKVL